MIELNNISNTRLIQQKLGRHYRFLKKLQLKGVGSSKMIYLGGIPFFDEFKNSGQDLDFISFELHPNGLIARYAKGSKHKGCIIPKNEIHKICFETTKVKVRSKNKSRIVYEALIDLHLNTGPHLSLYVPVAFYKSCKPFWLKDWLADIIIYTENPAKPRTDSNGIYLDILQSVLRL